MQRAAFSLVNFKFDKVVIDLEKHVEGELNIKFDTSGLFEQANKSFELTFDVSVFAEVQEQSFAQVRCKGLFKFENVQTFEEVPEFFYRNAIAILFPYVRAYLSTVTTQANVPGIILPTLNLSGLEADLKKNTTGR